MSNNLPVAKTYKLFINGAFPRSESGYTLPVRDKEGQLLATSSKASRKDIRDSVRAARSAQDPWASRTAYNRGQILYRIAEMMEARRNEFITVLESTGAKRKEAVEQVEEAIDRWVWYAGWADKIHHVLGTVNPVAGPYFNFTMPEPTGVVAVVAPEEPALLGLVSRLAPIIVSGNTTVVVIDAEAGLAAVTLAEVLATSDLPGGVVNLLTGDKQELLPWILGHLDINSVDLTGAPNDIDHAVLEESAVNVKRTVWGDPADESPYVIADFLEMKTVWHPIGR
ncbi:MAG: aldehyde dehydrogenase family protein [Actinomycetota bacterium]|nr:aldehyde dehydrogenase family protein [Actinomycetota bacterium]